MTNQYNFELLSQGFFLQSLGERSCKKWVKSLKFKFYADTESSK